MIRHSYFPRRFFYFRPAHILLFLAGGVLLSLVLIWALIFRFAFFHFSFQQGLHQAAPDMTAFSPSFRAEDGPGALVFADVPLDDQNAKAIAYLKHRHIVSGYADGTFRPQEALTRGDLLRLVVLALHIQPTAVLYRGCFDDVHAEDFAAYVCFAKAKGWIHGYEDGTFHPLDHVQKAQALKIIFAALKMDVGKMPSATATFVDVKADQWFASLVGVAQKSGVLQENAEGSYGPDEELSRAGAAELLYRSIQVFAPTL